QSSLIGHRIKRLPGGNGHFADFPGIEVRHDDPRICHAGPIVTLIERCLRGFQQKARRGRGEIRVLQLLFGGGIESDGAKRLRPLAAFPLRSALRPSQYKESTELDDTGYFSKKLVSRSSASGWRSRYATQAMRHSQLKAYFPFGKESNTR